MRATVAVLLFAFPAHSLRAPSHTRIHTFFFDATPCGKRFKIGVVGSPGFYRSYVCPRWEERGGGGGAPRRCWVMLGEEGGSTSIERNPPPPPKAPQKAQEAPPL